MVSSYTNDDRPNGATIDGDGALDTVTSRPPSADAYQALAAASPHWIYELDSDGRVLSMNPTGLRMLGLTDPKSAIGKRFASLVDPADESRIELMICRALEGKPAQFDFAGTIRGETRAFSSVLTLVRDSDGKTVRLIGQTQDITDFLRAENAAQESEARFYQAFQSAPCLMIISSLEDHRFIDVNDMFVESSGYLREDVLGRPGRFGEIWTDHESQGDMLELLARGERIAGLQTVYRCKSGEVRDALVSVEPVRVDGESCAVWQAIDITERLREDERRLELEAQLQQRQRLESLGLLAGSIAHDFNNLLGAILANTDLALRRTEPSPKGTALLERIRGAAMHAAELTSQMLAYSGRARLNIQPIELDELVRDMLRLLDVTLPKNATFTLHLASGLPRIRGDAAQVRQVLMNLLTNAAESLEGRPGEVIVRTAAAYLDEDSLRHSLTGANPTPGRYCLLAVSDSGCGMDTETRERIFDPFFTTKRDGRGLGLAAAIGIVRGHGGVIDIESEPGVGTTFSVWLPCVRSDTLERGASKGPPAKDERRPSKGTSGATVLIIDDDARFLEAVTDMVEGLGFQPIAVSNGAAATELFRQNVEAISVVLLDVLMPDTDGWEVLRSLRSIQPRIPVILMSGFVPTEQTGPRIEATGFLQKPFLLDKLQHALESVVKPPKR